MSAATFWLLLSYYLLPGWICFVLNSRFGVFNQPLLRQKSSLTFLTIVLIVRVHVGAGSVPCCVVSDCFGFSLILVVYRQQSRWGMQSAGWIGNGTLIQVRFLSSFPRSVIALHQVLRLLKVKLLIDLLIDGFALLHLLQDILYNCSLKVSLGFYTLSSLKNRDFPHSNT